MNHFHNAKLFAARRFYLVILLNIFLWSIKCSCIDVFVIDFSFVLKDVLLVVTTAELLVSYTVGLHHNFCCRGPILDSRPVLGSSAQTTQGMLRRFFVKAQNMLVWVFAVSWYFPGVFRHTVNRAQNRFLLSRNYRTLVIICKRKHNKYYWVHAHRLDFLEQLKNQFPNKPRHTRVFDEANSNLSVLFLSEHHFESLFKKELKWTTKNTRRIWILIVVRMYKSLICRSLFGLLENWFFVCIYLGSNPAVR